MTHSLIVLPMDGQPFIFNSSVCNGSVTELQKAVGGSFGLVHFPFAVIHPLFQKERASWKQAQKLIKNGPKTMEMYCNENGMFTCSSNVAMSLQNNGKYIQPLFGDIVILINNNWWNKNKHNYAAIQSRKKEEAEDV